MSGRAAAAFALVALVALAALAGCGGRGGAGAPPTGTATVDTGSVAPGPGLTPLTWPRVPGADVYRVEAYDTVGTLLGAVITRDTSVAAGELIPATAASGTWRVVAVGADGGERAVSAPVRFDRVR